MRICISFILLLFTFPILSVKAQLIPDNTLGKENSRVNSSVERDLIEGGAIRNNNLFHSFKEFNINPNQKVYFSNPDNITNILTRVTGSNASKIFGTLGVSGNANLFLINPKGIIFGKDAFLDITGSFTATTAESIFIDNYEFSAVNPNQTPLLKINLTPGLQYGKINPQSEIENRGILKVGEGKNLTLLGGRVFHQDTGSLIAPGGKVEISGDDINLKGTVDTRGLNGEIGILLIDPKDILIQENSNLSGDDISRNLAVNNVVLQANNDITVDDDITGIGTNNLTLEAGRSVNIAENRNIFLNGGSFNAKINDENALPSERDAGIAEFRMNTQSSIITNGGDVNIVSGSFGNTSQINTLSTAILSSQINGTSGNINLSAIGDIKTGRLISGILNPDGDSSLNAGDININSTNGDILTTDFILANSLIKGGNINIKAANNINLTAQQAIETGNIASIGGAVAGNITFDSSNAILSQNVRTLNGILGDGIGNDIDVNTKSLTIENGSIIALTFGESNGGNLLIDAVEEMILRQSSVATNADEGSSGNAGNLTINTKRLTVERIPGLPSPFAVGIGTRTDNNTTGNGGDLTINASSSVEIIGDRPGSFSPQPNQIVNSLLGGDDRTGITTSAEGSGISGSLRIDTPRLIVRDNAAITTVPFSGKGGDININASEILLQGLSGIGTGNLGEGAGDLRINTRLFTLTNGAVVGTSTLNNIGNAGNFILSVEQLNVRNGSLVKTETVGNGNGGNLIIKDASFIEVVGFSFDGSVKSAISASSFSTGNSGNLNIITDKLIVRDGGEITTATDINGIGGNIDINTRNLEINNGRINASTTTPQNGGDININASESIEVIGGGFEKLQQNIIIPAFDGNPNSITLNNFDNGIVTASQGEGNSGNIFRHLRNINKIW
ncbi:filamentous hemagglutinin outer membrane protein [Calothrix parasitica NIES-267]|uniref:Filamentous hemagglutinin outer membrane protein n=1 Tax=Calothrix parasitica NIES-267 TaxID=1973488 RepID=A0A1Z4LSW0_9CYAN|nr:filamentous hemagglutinin outer membrane protein [Calothrix parasitica NIES-267]